MLQSPSFLLLTPFAWHLLKLLNTRHFHTWAGHFIDRLWMFCDRNQDIYSGDKKALPGDPPSLHEAGRIPSSLPDGWVAAWAAPSSAVGVRAVGAVLFSAWQTVGRQSGSSKMNLDGESFVLCWVSPGDVLSAVRGLDLDGALVSGGRARGRAAAAPGAAALPEVGFAPRLVVLPTWHVWVASRRHWRALVMRLTSIRAVVTLGGVATFCPEGKCNNLINWFVY